MSVMIAVESNIEHIHVWKGSSGAVVEQPYVLLGWKGHQHAVVQKGGRLGVYVCVCGGWGGG